MLLHHLVILWLLLLRLLLLLVRLLLSCLVQHCLAALLLQAHALVIGPQLGLLTCLLHCLRRLGLSFMLTLEPDLEQHTGNLV